MHFTFCASLTEIISLVHSYWQWETDIFWELTLQGILGIMRIFNNMNPKKKQVLQKDYAMHIVGWQGCSVLWITENRRNSNSEPVQRAVTGDQSENTGIQQERFCCSMITPDSMLRYRRKMQYVNLIWKLWTPGIFSRLSSIWLLLISIFATFHIAAIISDWGTSLKMHRSLHLPMHIFEDIHKFPEKRIKVINFNTKIDY